MANVVCVDEATVRVGICEIDDIVSIHDDDVELSGPGYAGFKIVKIEGKTAAELWAGWGVPEQRRAVKIEVAGKWTFQEEKAVWKDSKGLWNDLIVRPKYSHSLKDLTKEDRTELASKETAVAVRDALIAKCKEKIHLDAKNLVPVSDLNG